MNFFCFRGLGGVYFRVNVAAKMGKTGKIVATLTARTHRMAISCQRGKGDATSHYAARRLRLAAAVGSVKWPSSRRTVKADNTTRNLRFDREKIQGKRIFLVDDITTRGMSFVQSARKLKENGAADMVGLDEDDLEENLC